MSVEETATKLEGIHSQAVIIWNCRGHFWIFDESQPVREKNPPHRQKPPPRLFLPLFHHCVPRSSPQPERRGAFSSRTWTTLDSSSMAVCWPGPWCSGARVSCPGRKFVQRESRANHSRSDSLVNCPDLEPILATISSYL